MDRERILELVITQIHVVEPALQGFSISASDSMADLGLDSMLRQEVLILSMEAIGLNLPMVQLFGPRNLGELADLLHARLHG